MEFNSQIELYNKIIPVLEVKKRLSSITEYKDIDNEKIWKYLAIKKWRYSNNLQICDIINDIMLLDLGEVYNEKEV